MGKLVLSRGTPRAAFQRVVCAVAVALLCWSAAADAVAEDEESAPFALSPWGVEIHAFVSQGFLYTTDNNYLARTQQGSAEFTEIGLNITKDVTDRLRIGMQLFTRDLGPIGNYRPQFDWGYLDYKFWDWLGIRAGRTKIPFGLYNEINDVDMARVPILLPQSVYPIENRDALLAVTGAQIYGYVPLGPVGQLEYRAYGGTIFFEIPTQSANAPASIDDFRVPYVFGGRVMWLPPIEGLQLGGSLQVMRFDFDYSVSPESRQQLAMAGAVPEDFDGKLTGRLPVKLWVASIEYSAHNLLLAAEYGRWHTRTESSLPAVIPNTARVNERFYALASYQVASWFAPCVYYSMYYVDVPDRRGRDAYQHDAAATLRFDITRNWLVKLEGHYMIGTALLRTALNNDTPLNELTREWGLFLLRTTAYF